MFQRNKRGNADPVSETVTEDDLFGGKGRPTPKRSQAESARKQRMKPPANRKEAAKLMRQKRYEERAKQRTALETGDLKHLPARDRGPVRHFCRDTVDARFSVGEFLLPILILILAMTFIRTPWAVELMTIVWIVTILAAVVDTLYLVLRMRRALKTRFPNERTRGAVAYTVLRSTQLRRFRLPKPQIKRGAPLKEHY